jgi:hypothetical protein
VMIHCWLSWNWLPPCPSPCLVSQFFFGIDPIIFFPNWFWLEILSCATKLIQSN